MALVHSYRMTAREGREDALCGALEKLADATRQIAGSQGTMVLADAKEPAKFLLLEFWDSAESRKAAGAQLPREVMASIMAAIGGPIEMTLWDRKAG
jgi:quinol monooxygenase YgiN